MVKNGNGKKWKTVRQMEKERANQIKEIRDKIANSQNEITDEGVMAIIEETLFSDKWNDSMTCRDLVKVSKKIFYTIRKELDILEPYAVDPRVCEIMVNGKDDIFVERDGQIQRVNDHFDSTERLEEVIRRLAARVHREINELNPIVDIRMDDGSRVNAVHKNIALNGPILTIRKFPETAFDMEALIDMGTLTRECASFLNTLVVAGYNCFISGGTSSGKTTFLNVLSNYIPRGERVIVIEDSAELQIQKVDNIVRMECKSANSEGRGSIVMDQLIRTSLRMRPDRIIVGEVRGKEVLDMIQAMNTGHDGSLSTGHGNSIFGMMHRLESMFLQAASFPVEAIRTQIAEALDIVINMGRMPDKSRKVLEISEIVGVKAGKFEINQLYVYRQTEGLIRTKNPLINREKLIWRGQDAN